MTVTLAVPPRPSQGARRTRAGVRRFIPDVRGSATVLMAAAMPAIIGFFGLGVEVGYWYLTEVKLQSVVDAAAVAGAAELRVGGSQAEIEAAALRAAIEAGFEQAGTLVVNAPPVAGAFTAASAVEVTAVQSRQLLFAAMFLQDAVVPNARAVALFSAGRPVCVLALDPSAPAAVHIYGSATVDMNGCEIASNSVDAAAFTLAGSAKLKADCVSTVGGAATAGGLSLTGCRKPIEGIAPIRDPYAGLPEPVSPTSCTAQNTSIGPKANVTLDPGRYCGGLEIKGTATLNPGMYIVDGGDLYISSMASLAGSGVTFFLTSGAKVQIEGGANVKLSAPTSGPYAGMLFFGDRDGGNVQNTFKGSSTSKLDGAIYFPAQTVLYEGGSTTASSCTRIVARVVKLGGSVAFDGSCSRSGLQQIARETIRVVE